MDLTSAGWQPPSDWLRLTVIDSHAGGEPFRVVLDGLPDIPGDSVLERRRYARENLDHLRRVLIWEPRGHADMYGGWVGPPTEPGSDVSVLFLHNEGFSTMCGHGIIALAKVLIDTQPGISDGRLVIDTPAGTVSSQSVIDQGRVTATSFLNVASFVSDLDAVVDVPEVGEVIYDLAFGGAYYAYVRASSVGVGLDDVSGLIDAGRAVKRAVMESTTIVHPVEPDLSFLYGVIFTGPAENAGSHSRNVCVFADGEVDRSPTGTGVSGLLAILHARGELDVGDSVTVESIVGSTFTGRIDSSTSFHGHSAVIPEISGRAHLTGRAELWLDPDDDLGSGFLIR
jgi:trans-L-3-hydroxyproline dehydratase